MQCTPCYNYDIDKFVYEGKNALIPLAEAWVKKAHWGYSCAPDHKAKIQKLLTLIDIGKRELFRDVKGFEQCLTDFERQLLYEAITKIAAHCDMAARKDFTIDVSEFDVWVAKNPHEVGYEPWEYYIYRLKDKYSVCIRVDKLTERNYLAQGAAAQFFNPDGTRNEEFIKRYVAPDGTIRQNAPSAPVSAAFLEGRNVAGWDIGLTAKQIECNLTYDIISEKIPCEITAAIYAWRQTCDVDFSISVNRQKCVLDFAIFAQEHKCKVVLESKSTKQVCELDFDVDAKKQAECLLEYRNFIQKNEDAIPCEVTGAATTFEAYQKSRELGINQSILNLFLDKGCSLFIESDKLHIGVGGAAYNLEAIDFESEINIKELASLGAIDEELFRNTLENLK